MLDPKTSLAIDAPPIAPYDDGFSTESEDFDDAEAPPDEPHASPLRIPAPSSVRSEAVVKNQPLQERQQIRAEPALKTAKHVNEKKSQSSTKSVAKLEEKSLKQAAASLNTARNGGQTLKEEHCKGCSGYLTPLAERLKAMQTAVSQHQGKGPPPSRQCCCCHITYPLVALTDESRSRACLQPRCYMCNWGANAAKNAASVGVKRTVDGAVKATSDAGRRNGEPEGKKESTGLDASCCCRNCKGPLPNLGERLKVMNATAVQLKIQGWRVSPPSRQCSCCYITYPLASLTEKSKSAMCATPICRWCNRVKAHMSGKAGSSSTVAVESSAKETRPNAAKTREIIEIEDEEELGRVEQDRCQCCHGQLMTLAARLQMTKDAAQAHGGKGPPPSRQCACCRITYPSVGLTKNSRKLTRTVPICTRCCRAGGSAIYEMLAASDEFIEAFKVENPAMARQLLVRKESGALRGYANNQKKRVLSSERSASVLQQVKAQRRELNQHIQTLRSYPVYHRPQLMARKCLNAPRLLLRAPVNGNAAAAQQTSQEPHTRRTARWLKQFEIVDGKTVRERRLEARNKAKERTLEKIRNASK